MENNVFRKMKVNSENVFRKMKEVESAPKVMPLIYFYEKYWKHNGIELVFSYKIFFYHCLCNFSSSE